MEIARQLRRTRELDMTPLIDIVFLLVIFFMLTTSFVSSESMELTLPEHGKQAKADTPKASAMRIQIDAKGALQLDDKSIPKGALEKTLVARLQAAPETPIGIFTTPGVQVQALVDVMDMVHLSGGRKVKVERVEYAPEPQAMRGLR
jgi:biopolymer transport protein ExbD